MNKDRMIENDKRKINDLLAKLKRGELCTPNCYGCCGDNELDFAYCLDIADNFEKELANLDYRKVADDEVVIKKSEYEKKLNEYYEQGKVSAFSDIEEQKDVRVLTKEEFYKLQPTIIYDLEAIDKAKQETAKEIFTKLIEVAKNNDNKISIGLLKAWAIEYDVEVEE